MKEKVIYVAGLLAVREHSHMTSDVLGVFLTYLPTLIKYFITRTKYASAVPKNLGVGVDFRPFSEGNFLSGCP